MRPTIGRIVWYRPRTAAYTVPAMITATWDTLVSEMVELGMIPGLSSPTHVHLTVFSPGVPAVGPNGPTARLRMEPVDAVEDASAEMPTGAASLNLAGTYQEWDTPFFDPLAAGGAAGHAYASTHPVPVSCAPLPERGELEWDVRLFDAAGDRVSCAPTNADPAEALTQPPGTWTWPERS
jgi:hypothetical protein